MIEKLNKSFKDSGKKAFKKSDVAGKLKEF